MKEKKTHSRKGIHSIPYTSIYGFEPITDKKNIEIMNYFPFINFNDDFNLFENDKYQKIPVSLWKKWARQISENPDDLLEPKSEDEARERDSKIVNLGIEIVKYYKTYCFDSIKHKFLKANKDILIAGLKKNNYESCNYEFYLPEIGVIYHVDFDWTVFFLILDDKELPQEIHNLIKKNNLYIIDI